MLLAPVHDVEKQHFAGFAVTKASADLPNGMVYELAGIETGPLYHAFFQTSA